MRFTLEENVVSGKSRAEDGLDGSEIGGEISRLFTSRLAMVVIICVYQRRVYVGCCQTIVKKVCGLFLWFVKCSGVFEFFENQLPWHFQYNAVFKWPLKTEFTMRKQLVPSNAHAEIFVPFKTKTMISVSLHE